MTKRDDEQTVGKALLSAVGAAARDAAGEKLTGSAKTVSDLLDEVVAQQLTVTIRIFRQASGINSGNEEFIAPLYNVNPELLREHGIESIIQNYCGGGTYRLLLVAKGIPPRTVHVIIAGEPKMPKPEGDLKGAAAGTAQFPWGVPMPMSGPAGMGFNAATPGFAQYLGIPSQQQPQSHVSDAVMLAQLFASLTQSRQQSGETEESKKLQEQIAELKTQVASAAQEKLRMESEQKASAQIAELKVQMEKMAVAAAAPKEDKLLALAPTLLAVAAEFMKSRDAAQNSQRELITAMLTSQKESSKDSIELMKSFMSQPRESETDRMSKIMDITANSMSINMGLMRDAMNQIASMQGPDKPWWHEVILNAVEQLGALGQAVMESRASKREGASQLPSTAPVPALPEATVTEQGPSMIDAASAAAAAAQEQLATPVEGEVRVAGVTEPEEEEIKLPDFSAGAFKTIFERIQDEKIDAHEIGFRIWKHATSGDKNALNWVQNPEEYTIVVLDTLARQGKILVTAERIEELVEVMIELYNHFAKGGNAEGYLKKFGVSLTAPKNVVVVPIEKGEPYQPIPEEEGAEEAGDGNGADKEAAVVVVPPPQPEAPKVPTTPTPSFGNSPPVREPV